MIDKYINLEPSDRFVEADVLSEAYLSYEESLNPFAPNFVRLQDGWELGIVSSHVPEIARAVSSILSCSLEDAKNTKGGYIPDGVVERVQLEIISPFGVAHLWGTAGHRFVLSRPSDGNMREIIASALVGRSRDTIFFFTGKYNNLRHSTIGEEVNLDLPDDAHLDRKWFDRFAFPRLEEFKPGGYHHIANFVVAKGCRGRGLSRLFLEHIVRYYSRNYLNRKRTGIQHSQHLLCGKGFWQIGDPPWLTKMQALGFFLRAGAESFFREHDWAPLPPMFLHGRQVSNIEYNRSFGLPNMYRDFQPSSETEEHLLHRLEEVMTLSVNPRAKLQYFQMMYNFVR